MEISKKKYLSDFYKLIGINLLLMLLAMIAYYVISPKIDLTIITLFYTGIFFISISSAISCFFLLKLFLNLSNSKFIEKSKKHCLKQSKYCVIISTLNLCLLLIISIFNWI